MMDSVAAGVAMSPLEALQEAARHQPELLDWLSSGRLTLMDKERRPIEVEQWGNLPADVRAHALEDFRRVVRGNAKAAVLFLK